MAVSSQTFQNQYIKAIFFLLASLTIEQFENTIWQLKISLGQIDLFGGKNQYKRTTLLFLFRIYLLHGSALRDEQYKRLKQKVSFPHNLLYGRDYF